MTRRRSQSGTIIGSPQGFKRSNHCLPKMPGPARSATAIHPAWRTSPSFRRSSMPSVTSPMSPSFRRSSAYTKIACGWTRSSPRIRATSRTTSRRPLLFSRVGDHVPQGIQVNGAGDDVLADDESGGPVDIERVGEREVGFQSPLDIRRTHVLLEPVDIEPYRAGYFIDRFFGDLTLGRHHCVMKGVVFALPLGRESGMRGGDRLWPEDRHFLV